MAESFEQAPGREPIDVDSADQPGEIRVRRGRRIALRTGAALGLVLVAAVGVAWLSREKIATNVIGSQLRQLGLPATYRIESIGGGTEVLRDIKVGDPAHPDLTIDRASVDIVYTLGFPRIGTVTLEHPRLYGRYTGGKLSFGSLDPVLFGGKSTAPAQLPDLLIALVDGRAQLLTDYGAVGVKAEGRGNLRDGFAGTLAAIAPTLALGGCAASGASAYGRLTTSAGQPRFVGPVRLARLRCDGAGIALDQTAVALDAVADKGFAGVETDARLRGTGLRYGSTTAESLALDGRLAFRGGALTGRVKGDAGGVSTAGAGIALLALDGMVRARDGFGRVEVQGTLDGRGVSQGPAMDAALATTQRSAEGTLVAPMLGQVRAALARERRGSRLFAEFDYRQQPGGLATLVVPQAQLRGGSGATLLALSRFQLASGAGTPRLSGNFTTGGPGLPRIAGRMEQAAGRQVVLHLNMAPYVAGGNSLAVPDMRVAQAADGALGFVGAARLTGAIPGGFARNLALPVDGNWSARGGLAVWRRCTTASFDSLGIAQVVLDRRTLTLCPPPGTAIVRSGGSGGLHIAAGAPSLALSGRLGQTPIRLATGPIGFAWPGYLQARAIDVALGPDATATKFRLNDLRARLGSDVTGTFGGIEARLAAVPLDLTNASGDWRYAAQKLTIANATFDLTDRQSPARFEKLVARDATLSLLANRIDADATLREPRSGRAVVRALIRHDLGSGNGHADLAVNQLLFDKAVQPDTLTRLALGTVANVAGTIDGTGQVDWTPAGVTSGGRFTTKDLDLAAAFGPVKGLSGALVFTDLLGMVTAPDQHFKVASINPGIEVADGDIAFTMLPGNVLALSNATWPFLGGTLHLEPVKLNLGVSEERRYILVIDGLDAAKFIEKMQLGNLNATGTFDGRLPLVFTDSGGRIDGGMLTSRPPGGTVSYVGALTYKNLSAMANFAFDALKSLDYRTMTIGMDGALEGDIVTRVRFDGVKQGTAAKKNFVTRSFAKLPLQFNVNIRAPFYQLVTSVKALYDPAYVKDPRTLGLVDAQGRAVVRQAGTTPPHIVLPDIQPSASETMP
ncbi:YdbH domain-containing protein [Novosphingobium lentum]|uniref:YdbH domain-containing protein n=1 Tax=Novosphingobium lentum TaxID=145287 RepID=UPI00082C9599|nr:YdbH domain-containing protein [Novosphingobium lentum]